MRETVLIVEDNVEVAEMLTDLLSGVGFEVMQAHSAARFGELCAAHEFDLFMIDLTLPDHNGLDLVRDLRQSSDAGIIIVTGHANEVDHVIGLELGADDYVTKPFRSRELVARINSVLRRRAAARLHDGTDLPLIVSNNGHHSNTVLGFDRWRIDLDARSLVGDDGSTVTLTTAEYDLLKAFVEAPGRVHTRDHLLGVIHGGEWAGYDRGVDGLISRLRRKLESDPQHPDIIKTVRGAGYLFSAEVVPAANTAPLDRH